MSQYKADISKLTGVALDYAVAMCVLSSPFHILTYESVGVWEVDGPRFNPSENWAISGPLFDRYKVVWRHHIRGVEARCMKGEIGVSREASKPYMGDDYIQSGLRALVGNFYAQTIALPSVLEL